jgi:hypothetical protein
VSDLSYFRLYHLPVLLKIRVIAFSVIPSLVTPINSVQTFVGIKTLLILHLDR